MADILSEYFEERRRHLLKQYTQLNRVAQKGQTVLVGSSLAERFPILELKQSFGLDKVIYNRGIGGYKTEDLIPYLDICLFDLEPSEVFMNIGSNDMGAADFTVDKLEKNLRIILDQTKERLPECRVKLLAYYPINNVDEFPPAVDAISFATRNNQTINACNEMVKALAKEYGYEFIDLNAPLYDDKGCLKQEYSLEGLHLWPDAYIEIYKELLEYID